MVFGFNNKPEQQVDGYAEQHPALKNFSETIESIKHVTKKTLKGALKGALVGGLAIGAAAALPGMGIEGAGWLTSWIPGVGENIAGKGAELVGRGLVFGAMSGAGVGGSIGFVSGVNGAEEAAEDKAEELKNKWMRAQRLEQQQQQMAMNAQRAQMVTQTMGQYQPSHGLAQGAPPAPNQGYNR